MGHVGVAGVGHVEVGWGGVGHVGVAWVVKGTKTTCFGIKVIYTIYDIKDHLRALRY